MQPHRRCSRSGRPARRARSSRPRARACRAAAPSSTPSVGTHHTPARRSVPCSVSSSAGGRPLPSLEARTRTAPDRRVAWATCFVVDEQPPALHQVDDERDRLELEQQVLAPPPDPVERGPYAASGAGLAVFERRERQRHEPLQPAAPANSSARRSACACTSGISGIGRSSRVLGAVAHRREHGVERAEHRLGVEQPLLVAAQADAAADERLLGVELAGGRPRRRCPSPAPCGRARDRRRRPRTRASPSPTCRW